MEKTKVDSKALKWVYDKYIRNDPESVELYKEYQVKADIAQQVYDLRNQAGLSQEQIAELVGVGQSVIRSLEDADYEGDFLAMLVRIASTLQRKVEVRLVPDNVSESTQQLV